MQFRSATRQARDPSVRSVYADVSEEGPMTNRILSRIGISLTLALLLVLMTAGGALAWTAANLQPVTSGEDQFYTYDFTTRTLSANGVDWPVTIIFYGNASVSKVKKAFQSRGWSNPFVNTMYAYLNDGSGFSWTSDGGVKTFATKSSHMRVYAPGGRMYNSVWGYYVVATTHFDNAELSSPPTQWFGMSEDAAGAAVQTATKAWGSQSVSLNAVALGNAQYGEEKGTNGERHIWQCDGKATLIRVP
jgi:hypothetical protein